MKNLKNLGKALNKAEQKQINGGRGGSSTGADVCCEWVWSGPMGTGTGTCIDYVSNEFYIQYGCPITPDPGN